MDPAFLNYFLEPTAPETQSPEFLWRRVQDIDELQLPRSFDATLRIEAARDLLFRHYRLRPEVGAEVDAARRRLFGNSPALSVHFRGTDKISEADRVQPQQMIEAIRTELAKLPEPTPVFVATDEQLFLDECTAHFGSRVVSLPDHRRSIRGQPVHKASTASVSPEMPF